MNTVHIKLADGSEYTGTLQKVEQVPPAGPTGSGPTSPTIPTTPTGPTTPTVVPTEKQILRAVDPEFTNTLRARGASILEIPLGADQEIALEIDRARFDDGSVFRVFQASSDLAIALSATPWDFGPPGVRTPLYDNVGGGMSATVKGLTASIAQLPASPNGKLYFNVRWSVYTAWGAGAPLRNFLKEAGLTVGKFEFRKDR
jgi:hypothetical protein